MDKQKKAVQPTAQQTIKQQPKRVKKNCGCIKRKING